MSAPAAFPDKDTTAAKLSSFGEADQAFVRLLMENPEQEEIWWRASTAISTSPRRRAS
jgi:hypothetical protein